MVPANCNAIVEIDAPEKGIATVEIQLDGNRNLMGRVVDSTGKPVEDFSYTGNQTNTDAKKALIQIRAVYPRNRVMQITGSEMAGHSIERATATRR